MRPGAVWMLTAGVALLQCALLPPRSAHTSQHLSLIPPSSTLWRRIGPLHAPPPAACGASVGTSSRERVLSRYIFHAVGSWNKWNAMVGMLQQCRIPVPDIVAQVDAARWLLPPSRAPVESPLDSRTERSDGGGSADSTGADSIGADSIGPRPGDGAPSRQHNENC